MSIQGGQVFSPPWLVQDSACRVPPLSYVRLYILPICDSGGAGIMGSSGPMRTMYPHEPCQASDGEGIVVFPKSFTHLWWLYVEVDVGLEDGESLAFDFLNSFLDVSSVDEYLVGTYVTRFRVNASKAAAIWPGISVNTHITMVDGLVVTFEILETLEESSKPKPIKKFTYIISSGEHQMTKEEIKNQKGIEELSKAKALRDDDTTEAICNFKVSNFHVGEWKNVLDACPKRTRAKWNDIFTQMR
uniref:Uncharacterized protein n=1 Tax=Tanacetum cinerariifolium TaxID=118510 RepID=A0A699GK63_TANCI|nr:hypothetical protein [Tanacetum cinerariifolium]